MQPNIKNDLLYLLGILESVGKIEKYTETCFNADDFYFANEQLNFNASLNLLGNIGELCSKISKELKIKYKNINWREIKDFRNKITHDYAGLDIYIVFEIIKNDLPLLKQEIENLLKIELQKSTFDINELNAAKNSKFYTHINFTEVDT